MRKWQMSKRELADYDRKISTEERSLAGTQAALQELKQKLDACDEQLEALQTGYVTVIQKLEQLEGQKQIFQQRAMYSSKNQEEQAQIIAEKEALIKTEKANLAAMRAELAAKVEARKELSEKRASLSEKEAQLTQNKTELVQQLRNDYINRLQEQSSNRNTTVHLEKEMMLATEQEHRFPFEKRRTQEESAPTESEAAVAE